jgi:hypothetical protein
METVFKTELTGQEIGDIREFCSGADYFSLEQSIGFSPILYTTKITYFWLHDGERIKSFCQISENIRFAHIWFGPVCNDPELIIISINEIVTHYKQRNFLYLGVLLYLKSGPDCDLIEYALNRSHSIRYVFDNANTKSSLEIDLNQSTEAILRAMRKGHKSDIRKAENEGINVQEVQDPDSIRAFTTVYRKMCRSRSIAGHSEKETEAIIKYIIENKIGQMLIARDPAGLVVGGAVFAYQGLSVRYLISASDPERRELPMSHLVIYRAILQAKEAGFRYFDFWGYNHFADKDDQVFKVNSFKKGFGGYYTFFAKKMNFNLVPGGYNIYRLFGVMKRMKGKFKR